MTQYLITVMYMYAGHSMLSILSEITSVTRWIHIQPIRNVQFELTVDQ